MINTSDISLNLQLINPESSSPVNYNRSEEHTSELQSHSDLVCRLLLEKKKKEIERNEGADGRTKQTLSGCEGLPLRLVTGLPGAVQLARDSQLCVQGAGRVVVDGACVT